MGHVYQLSISPASSLVSNLDDMATWSLPLAMTIGHKHGRARVMEKDAIVTGWKSSIRGYMSMGDSVYRQGLKQDLASLTLPSLPPSLPPSPLPSPLPSPFLLKHPCLHRKVYETRPDQTRPNKTRPDQTEQDQTRPDRTGPDQTRPNRTRLDQTEQDQTRLDQTRPNRTRLDQTEQDQTRPDQTGPDWTRPD